MEAGRLAAEYLVYKGLLPASSLPPKGQNGRFQGFKGQERDPPAPDGGRTSALNRLGNLNSDSSNGRRRYNDEYDDRMGPRNQFRGKKRMSPYGGRDYGSDWGRENSGRWMGRNRGCNNDMEDEDDFGAGYQRDRRSAFDQLPSRSENTMESGSENHDIAEDSTSKASSSSTRRDPPGEMDGDLSKGMADDGKGMSSEVGEELKSDASGDSKKKDAGEESDVKHYETEGDSKSGDDLMKLCTFAKVPTRPRSSAAQKSPKAEQGITGEGSDTVDGSSGEPKVISGEDVAGGSSNNVPADQTDIKGQPPEIQSTSPFQPLVESVGKEEEGNQSQQGVGSLKPTVYGVEEASNEMGWMKRQRDPTSEDEFSDMHNVGAKKSSPEVENLPVDENKVDLLTAKNELHVDEEMSAPVATDEEKPQGDALNPKVEAVLDDKMEEGDALNPKVEPELSDEMEEEKQFVPSSFKICDLNLMQAPEITEIPDDSDPEQLPPSASRLQSGKGLSMDFGLSIGSDSNGADEFSRLSGDDKIVQVIDLEDDSPVDPDVSDPSRSKDESMYPNLDSFLNQPEHGDLSGIQDGYSLEISEFLGSDISRCPSVPSDLNNLETGMGLHDAEGVPNDDDSIYVSLGEIPIGFMEVWDQPPQEYGKFF